jgi:hypothetical protein
VDLQPQRVLHEVDLPVGGLSPADVPATRRWMADPLVLLTAVAVAALAVLLRQALGTAVPWQLPALLGVVAAGLALSGST